MTKPFALEFAPLSTRHGWMDCWLIIHGERQQVYTSSVFPPFRDLLKFARAVAVNQLPHKFNWDEEGRWVTFKAFPLKPGSENFRMVINRDRTLLLSAELNRMDTVKMLVEQLRRVALDCPGAESEWAFPYFLLEEFEREWAQGFTRESSSSAVTPARFVFYPCGGYGGVTAPAFCVWLGEAHVLLMLMQDDRRCWRAWFDMLERIRSADFPFDYNFYDIHHAEDPEEMAAEEDPWPWTFGLTFCAEAADLPEHFRLRVQTQGDEMEPTLICDVTADRQAFVDEFIRAFKEFLNTDYLGFLENGELRCDLRSLLPEIE